MTVSADPAQQIVATAREMLTRGLVFSTVGNVSVRWEGGLMITPSRRRPDDLTADDLVVLDLHGRQASNCPGRPSLEWRMHAEIYCARPDIGAVVHTHSPHATARSFDARPLLVETEEREYFGVDRIDVAEPAPAGSPELAHAAVRALGPRPAALLARHGVVGVGLHPRDAMEACCLVEHQALIDNLRRTR
jgi:L-fuculose-phosphate aldolase